MVLISLGLSNEGNTGHSCRRKKSVFAHTNGSVTPNMADVFIGLMRQLLECSEMSFDISIPLPAQTFMASGCL